MKGRAGGSGVGKCLLPMAFACSSTANIAVPGQEKFSLHFHIPLYSDTYWCYSKGVQLWNPPRFH